MKPIPIIDVSASFAVDSIKRFRDEARAFGRSLQGRAPDAIVHALDGVSRRFLEHGGHPYQDEISEVSRIMGIPGAYFLNVMFEWGCTVRAHDTKRGPELVRVLDWSTPGLGAFTKLLRIPSKHGAWQTLSWPGFVGIVHGMAKGRFALALNQAPMTRYFGLMPLDWVIERQRTWQAKGMLPVHLLRRIMEEADTYDHAVDIIMGTPLCIPVIFSIVGVKEGQHAIIEVTRESAIHSSYVACAANHFERQPDGHHRGAVSPARARSLERAQCDPGDRHFTWLKAPVLNSETVLAFIANPARGTLIARGYHEMHASTETLLFQA